jgi:hypothetical protein
MMTPQSRQRPLATCFAILALALPVALWAQPEASPVASNPKKTHTITITHADGAWHYSIYPAQADPKKAKVKRGDTLNWICSDGSWQVFFKNGVTPLVDGNGYPVSAVNGGSGEAAGATIGVKPKDGDTFTYGVQVHPNGGGSPVVDDPEIIIES